MEVTDKMSKVSEKIRKCNKFFYQLAELLKDDYEIVYPFGKNGFSSDKYLVPKGTKDKISYYGKPVGSFRFSTHWNWRESLDKCTNERYIQCLNVDLPFAKKRDNATGRSKPIMAEQIAYYGIDCKYHAIYGEMINKKTHKWEWLEDDPEAVVNTVYILRDIVKEQ
jgi:hypothetical protein